MEREEFIATAERMATPSGGNNVLTGGDARNFMAAQARGG